MKRILTLILLLLALPAQAELRASVDKNPLLQGEVLTLTLSSDKNDEPDLDALEADFEILGRSSSSQVQLINGTLSRKHDWIIQLRPKRLGTLRIPALGAGQDRSRPIDIEVRQPQTQAGEWPEAFIEFEADKSQAWLREQVLLTARLFVRGNLVSGNFSEPSSNAAVIEQLGETQESQALRGPHRYRVIERRYALFAEQSGELNLGGLVFNGEIASSGQQRRGLFYSTPTRSIYATADPIVLNIQAPPESLSGANWLPASRVILLDSLQPDASTLKAGEPVTRTIKLQVDGQLHTQLPALDIANPPDAQAYTEPPQDETRSDGKGLIATRSYSTAIIAGQGPSLELPAVELQWWDTGSDSLKTARIPARSIPLEGPAQPASSPQPSATPALQAPAVVSAPPLADSATLRFWKILAISCAAGWLGTLLAWFWVTRKGAAKPTAQRNPDSRKQLLRTLGEADAADCRQALLAWARSQTGRTQTLSNLARQTSQAAQAAALHGLDAAAFGRSDSFDRDNLLRFVEQFGDPAAPSSSVPLAPLYPE